MDRGNVPCITLIVPMNDQSLLVENCREVLRVARSGLQAKPKTAVTKHQEGVWKEPPERLASVPELYTGTVYGLRCFSQGLTESRSLTLALRILSRLELH